MLIKLFNLDISPTISPFRISMYCILNKNTIICYGDSAGITFDETLENKIALNIL